MEKRDIRHAYDRFARWYDAAELLPEVLVLRSMRRALLARARGRVLEVAIGTGRSLAHYPAGTRIVGADLSHAMVLRARRKARRSRCDALFAVMDGERLAAADHAFDTVVSSLTLCTFTDPIEALREMARACRPGGRILLVEHGRSTRGWLARFQDRRADRHAALLGCRWNREPLELVRAAGLEVIARDRRFLDVFHAIEARPGPAELRVTL